jgi:hypothetical protein
MGKFSSGRFRPAPPDPFEFLKPFPDPQKSYGAVQFPVVEGKGMIAWLIEKHGANLHDAGVVTVTSKSALANYEPKNVVSRSRIEGFRSRNEDNEWICWDFGSIRVKPSQYEISGLHLASWCIEGSLDGENWTELDRQGPEQFLGNLERRTVSFHVVMQQDFRFIRLTQSDRGGDGGEGISLFALELFGMLFDQ